MSGVKAATTMTTLTGVCCSGTSRRRGHMLASLCLWTAILLMSLTTVCQAEAAAEVAASSSGSRSDDNGHHGNDSKATVLSRIMNTRRRSTRTTTKSSTVVATSSATNQTSNDTEVVTEDTIIVLSLLSMVNTVVFVLPNTIRYAVRKRQCLSSNGNNGNGCICTEAQLRAAIGRTKTIKSDDIDVLVLCPAIQVTLSQTIDVTNASFRIVCAISRFINTDPCVLDDSESESTGNSRLFSGTPRNAAFQDVIIRGSNRGAVYATGGNWTFHDVTFVNNRADETETTDSGTAVGSAAAGAGMGGAIYVAAPTSTASTSIPPAYVTLFGETSFQNNVASAMGNDVYMATSASTTANAFVYCEASSILSRPQFCNGNSNNNGLVVRSPSASSIEKAIYTNCFAVADFAC